MMFYIEYETPPLRSINYMDLEAESETEARKQFSKLHPRSNIRKIEGYHN